ncbi:hypothetical protein [Mesorhizobium sp. 8]|uniref:hypothetical protein n=1 Tax=Mesorhizobium sp. 8 TaxID=2584466 RepID=UPI0011234773|nr:hypothetical protein [Mesorhizobium sp. 8]QDC00388.1 hypothetical protein FGU64_08135 [Mesorhizobium sp. 8]
MFGIPTEQIIPIANFIGLGILGVLAYFGQKWGKAQPTHVERAVEVAGALVDNTAVRELATALTAHTAALVASRLDNEKERQARYRMMEIGSSLTGEVEELRRAIADAATQIARLK